MVVSKNDWLSLSAAAQMLGIHPSTVRLWADKGLLPAYRTKGGHRRFKRQDIELWLETSRQQHFLRPAEMMSAVLRNIRFHIAESALAQEGWYAKLDSEARQAYRTSGQNLIKGLMIYLSTQQNDIEAEAHALGYEYASRAHRYRLNLPEAIQAFLFFRNSLFNSIYILFSDTHTSFNAQHQTLLNRATAFTDKILSNLVETYLLMENNA